ncbi:hypothetical protein [uncultured Phocaeicola sp.]|nr:hypothetical protein [uncultured Phocaeicola sp.]
MKPLLWSLVMCAVVCCISLFVTQWMGLAEKWCTLVSVFLGIVVGIGCNQLWQRVSH